MKIFQKGFELPKLEYYKTHLRIINALFPVNITDKEIEYTINCHKEALEHIYK